MDLQKQAVAQMNKYLSVGMTALCLSVPVLAQSAEQIPEAGIAAEGKGQWTEAVKIYQQSLKNNPNQPHLWQRIADIQARLGDLGASAAALNEATRYAPADAGLYAKLSEVHAAAKNPKAALAAIDQAVALEPKNLKYLQARASLASWAQDYAKSADSYSRILALAPDSPDAVLGMARTQVWQGNLEQAAANYKRYVDGHPADQAALKEYINVETRRKQYESALDLLNTSRQRFGADLGSWMQTSDIEAAAGNPKGAAAALEQATKYAPADGKLYLRLSQTYAVTQDGKSALTAINHAVQLEPNNLEYLRARGVLATWNADYVMAGDSYSRVLAIAPDDAAATLGLAHSYSQRGDADKAIKLYRAYLEKHPQDKIAMMEYMEDEATRGNAAVVKEYGEIYRQRFGESREYWLRMADIEALAGDDRASAEAIRQATRFAQNDANLFYRLSQTYPELKDVKNASAAIERAVQLEPKNLEFLRARADLAGWGSDYATALDSYDRILAIAPDDPGAMLGIARIRAWKGDTDKSAKSYKAYLAKYPQVQVVWIEYIEVEAERGNYALAMELLEKYRQQYGETAPYLKQKARVLAWAERPTPSLAIVHGLHPTMPNDYELATTHTIALAGAHRPREAVGSLSELTRLEPDSKETADTTRVIKTPLRSNINFMFGYMASSDDITIKQLGVNGEYVLSPETRLFAGSDKQWLNAAAGSGYETVSGETSTEYNRNWIGARHLFTPKISVDAQVGGGTTSGAQNFIYEVGADLQLKDNLSMRVSRRQDLFVVSPRAASLGIERRANTLTASWQPDLRYTVDSLLSYDTFSDGNTRWEANLAPRRAVVRSQYLNLDLGVGGRWFSYKEDPGNGYYAPNMYRRYSVTAYSYWKLSDDNGISVTASAGPYKDNTMDGYRTGGDLVVEGVFGLYRDWMLDARASLSSYGAGATGAYRSRLFELILTRRF
ncbi:tetratricopeptide repeat protein [Sulfuriferula thiophila]|uniref:tetratricopeptide repeat protein n=1 Tax=Sulfuriferula thiophila TaxID=1781211 RepID=UPI000F60C209|nr:tetratricopeptide repeat protein [Sulfuriferula thiophila]